MIIKKTRTKSYPEEFRKQRNFRTWRRVLHSELTMLTVRRKVDLPRDWMAMRGPRTGSEMTRHREFTTSCRRGGRAINEAVTSDIGAGHQVSGIVFDPSSVA